MNKTTLVINLCCAFLTACSSPRDEANSVKNNKETGTYSYSVQDTVGFDNPLNHNPFGEEILSAGNKGKVNVYSTDFRNTADVIEEMDEVDEAILIIVNHKAFVGVKLLDKDRELSVPLKNRIKGEINKNIPNLKAIHITTDIAFLKDLESEGGLNETK